jgi:hypothetical protein
MRRVKHAKAVSLTVVLACVLGTMVVGTALKSPCASGNYDGRQYRLLCYSDIVPLLGTEQLGHGRLPFLDRCAETGNNCDEYPVLTMYLMRWAWFSGNDSPRYYANALLLGVRVLTAVCVVLGERALWFALALTLLVYGTIPTGAVAFATAALVAFAKRRRVGRRADRPGRGHQVLPRAGPAALLARTAGPSPIAPSGPVVEAWLLANSSSIVAKTRSRGGSSSGSTASGPRTSTASGTSPAAIRARPASRPDTSTSCRSGCSSDSSACCSC